MNTVTGQQEEQSEFVWVPRSPTEKMIDDAFDDATGEDAAAVWATMIRSYEKHKRGLTFRGAIAYIQFIAGRRTRMNRYSWSSLHRDDTPQTNTEAYWFLESVRYHLQDRQDNALLCSNVERYRALTEARLILVECGRILNAEFKATCEVAA